MAYWTSALWIGVRGKELGAAMSNAGNIVVLTGAGISKASGLATFRDPDGVWEKHQIEDVATPDAFINNTMAFLGFYDDLRRQVMSDQIQPNAAHFALARLEQEWLGEVTIITQNVDDLHEQAGSNNVIHMHGEILKARCSKCDHVRTWMRDMDSNDLCNVCEWEAELRPHVVLFGEAPLMMSSVYSALDACDVFLSIGTSLNVHPADTFVEQVSKRRNTKTVELNLEPSECVEKFDEAYVGAATDTVPLYVSGMLASFSGKNAHCDEPVLL
jgi:NAD-dependent deacetylase